jgi:glycosyltransferase involved in cell wall biosynthesis
MNILNVLDYSPDFGGGFAQHLAALGRKTAMKGHKLFLGFPKTRNWQNDLMSQAEIIIIPEIQNALWSGFPRVLRKVCKSKSVDILHIHFNFAQAFSLACSFRKWGVPTVYHWHNPPVALNRFLTPLDNIKGLLKLTFSSAVARLTDSRIINEHISMSKEITELLVRNKWTTYKKITFLPNGVSILFSEDTKPRVKTSNAPVIGTVANFRPQKDHETLLNAFRNLMETGLECELWIIGDGPTKASMEKLASDLGIKSSVRFLGTISNPIDIYRKFDIFVLSTHYEGHPLVVLEAMSIGLPIVATRISSLPEVITDGVNGFLVNPKDPHDLARAFQKILTDKALYSKLSEASLKFIKEQQTVDDWAENVLSVYERLLLNSIN